jgi:hypothetical protein
MGGGKVRGGISIGTPGQPDDSMSRVLPCSDPMSFFYKRHLDYLGMGHKPSRV